MPDNLQSSGGEDRLRINLNQEHELRDWSKKFDVTVEQLREAVAKVGDRADDVEMHLKGSRATTQGEQIKKAGG